MVHSCFMVGNPRDTRDTLQESLDLALKLNDDTMQFFPLIVYPGTPDYEWAKENLTPKLIKEHFQSIAKGEIIRYEMDNLLALNFILGDSLGGGGSESLLNDAQGKTHGQALLLMEVDLPDNLVQFVNSK